MIKAIAIDDEPRPLQVIGHHASRIGFLELKEVFTDPFKALDYILEKPVGLIFLDINMPDISGLEFCRQIRNKNILIIFTTAYSEYAVESYEAEAIDYLLKPFEFSRFHTAVSKAHERLSSRSRGAQEFCFVSSGTEQHRLPYAQIQYIEGCGNYVIYHLTDRDILVRSTIRETLSNLPPAAFVQVQRSFIVSLSHIDKIQDSHISIGSKRLSIGPKYRHAFQSLISSLT